MIKENEYMLSALALLLMLPLVGMITYAVSAQVIPSILVYQITFGLFGCSILLGLLIALSVLWELVYCAFINIFGKEGE